MIQALLLASLSAAAQTPGWTVEAATSAVLGQELVVAYTAPSGLPPGLVPLTDATTDFIVAEVKAAGPDVWAWTLIPATVGPAEFVARWRAGDAVIEAPPLRVRVADSDLPQQAEIRDIREPLRARPALWPWLLAAVLAELARRAWLRWRARPAPAAPGAPPAPPVPPEAVAASRLAALEASGLWEAGRHAEYYLELTAILREYLEARYGAPATAMTSAEVARLLRDRHGDLAAAARARAALERADLVKFARAKAGPGDGPDDARLVRELVRATTPLPPAEARA